MEIINCQHGKTHSIVGRNTVYTIVALRQELDMSAALEQNVQQDCINVFFTLLKTPPGLVQVLLPVPVLLLLLLLLQINADSDGGLRRCGPLLDTERITANMWGLSLTFRLLSGDASTTTF